MQGFQFNSDYMETPKVWRDWLIRHFNVNCDVAADPSNAIVERYFSDYSQSAFKQDWPNGKDDVCFLHPPYSQARKFIRFGTWQAERCNVKLILLYKGRMGGPIWQDIIFPQVRYIFIPRGEWHYVFKGKVMGEAATTFAFCFFNIPLTLEKYMVMKEMGSILIPHPEMVDFGVRE
jgi:hypothetical protein